MGRRLEAIAIALLCIFCISAPSVSQQIDTTVADQAYTPKVVFLEHYMTANGTVVSGEAPFRSVNFPSYWYNNNTGQINGKVDFPVNASLQMVFGDVLTLKGNFGAGTGNKLYGVYNFPVTADQAYIYGMDMSGNIAMRVNDQGIVLRPGKSYRYSENETVKDGNATVEIQYDHTYINHGYIDKSNIGTSAVSHS